MNKIIISLTLVFLVFSLTACPGANQRSIYLTYNSYGDMLEFASQHNQVCQSDNCKLFMFDFDKYDDVTLEYYYVSFMWFAKGWDYFAPVVEDKIPAEHFEGHNGLPQIEYLRKFHLRIIHALTQSTNPLSAYIHGNTSLRDLLYTAIKIISIRN